MAVKHFHSGLLFAVLSIMGAGCGGHGGSAMSGGGGGDGDAFVVGPVQGTIELSELQGRGDRGTGPLTVLTPIGKTQVGDDGRFTVSGFVNSQTPAIVLDSENRIQSFAYISQGDTWDTGLAAKSLTYVSTKAALFLPAFREVYFQNLGDAPEVQELRQDLVTLGGHLGTSSPEEFRQILANRLTPFFDRLRNGGRALIDPPGGQSGIEVLQQGLNEIYVVNHYRRRAHAFVERIEVTDENGLVTSYQQPYFDFSIDPIANPSSLNAALADAGTILGSGNSLFTGNVAWVPTQSEPRQLTLVPPTAQKVKYRYVVVGPGIPNDAIPNITNDMREAARNKWVDTLTLDVVIPLVMTLAGPMIGSNNHLNDRWDAQDIAQIIALAKDIANLALAYPQIQAKYDSGDIVGCINDTIGLVMGSEGFNVARTKLMRFLILKFAPNADETVVNEFLENLGKVLQFVDWGLQAADIAAISGSIAASKWAEEFTVTITRARVKLTPQAATISVMNSADLLATVPDATGDEAPLIYYKFKMLSGANLAHLKNLTSGATGSELTSSDGRVQVASLHHTPGTVQIEVEAFVNQPGDEDTSLGTASARVEIVHDKAVLRPAKVSVLPNGSHTFTCTINNPGPNSRYMFKWRTSGTFGTIDAPQEVTADNNTVYTSNGSIGTDTITVEVWQHSPGGLVKIGEAKSEVLVEARTSIVPATYSYVIPNSTTFYAIVSFAKPSWATKFKLRGVGGYDPAYYGASITSVVPPTQLVGIYAGIYHDLGPGNLGWTLSGGSGPNPEQSIPWSDYRFGGFSFYVECSE